MNRLKKTGQILLCPVPMLLVLLLQTICGTACVLILSLLLGDTSGEAFFSDHYMAFATGMQLLSLFLASIAYYALYGVHKPFPHPLDRLTFRNTVQLLILGFGCYCSIAILIAIIYTLAPDLMLAYEQMINDSGLSELSLLSTITTLILAPLSEELIFRGITHRLAYKAFGSFWAANVVQAILFGIAHLNVVQGIYAFVLGLMLGYVCRRCRTLYASILLHFSFNFFGTYMATLLESLPLPESLVALVLFGIGLPVSYRCLKYLQPKNVS